MAEPKNHLMHYRDGKRMALCGRMAWAAVGALGKRSLKRSGLTRRLFAPGRDDARPRFASAHPSRPEFTR